ncbi:hypothetical protein RBH29_13360 [Herbivorax sp. ANBcel31]|nr:hypothetical protein [Herbivorax sp. ANBcel31]MDQ2087414.1 hypothetical protein [Herbivorax sp. ANBcel31]
MNNKLKIAVFNIIVVVTVFVATVSTYASWPFRIFQEEVPKCLLEKDD